MAILTILLFAVVATNILADDAPTLVKRYSVATYRVVLKTADVSNAGTNSWVYLTIDGSLGSTQEKGLDAPGNDMVRGHTDVHNLKLEDVGRVDCVRFRIKGRDGWMPEEVQVYKNGNLVYKSGKINIWLDSYQTLKFCSNRAPRKYYRIITRTDDASHSGTDSAIYFKLSGSNGWTNEVELNNSGNDRRRGKIDEYEFTLENIGSPICIKLRTGGNDGWRIKQVQIYGTNSISKAGPIWDSGDLHGLLLDSKQTETICPSKYGKK